MIEQAILEITAELSQAKNIVIVPHKGPDGDAMGSTLGLMHFLRDILQTQEFTLLLKTNHIFKSLQQK